MSPLELFLIGFVLGASAYALRRIAQLERALAASKKVVPSGTVLHVGGLYIDAFVTDTGNVGVTFTVDHPDEDTDPRFLDVFVELKSDGIRLAGTGAGAVETGKQAEAWTPHTPGEKDPTNGGLVAVLLNDGSTNRGPSWRFDWTRPKGYPSGWITAWRKAEDTL